MKPAIPVLVHVSILSILPLLACCSLVEKGTHNPGKTCTWAGCHGYGAPEWRYAGTVFTSPERLAPAQGVNVIIVQSTGEIRLKSNSAGNFYALSGEPRQGYDARISKGDETRTMPVRQTNGACNSCHSPDGMALPLHID